MWFPGAAAYCVAMICAMGASDQMRCGYRVGARCAQPTA